MRISLQQIKFQYLIFKNKCFKILCSKESDWEILKYNKILKCIPDIKSPSVKEITVPIFL